MEFNKNKFIKENSQSAYIDLCDFLRCEIYEYTYKYLIFLLSCENLRSFVYEGNQYLIVKNENNSKILIVDEVSREHGVQESRCTFEIENLQLLELVRDGALERV